MSKDSSLKLTKQMIRKVHDLRQSGSSHSQIITATGLSRGSVYRALKASNPTDEEIQAEIAEGVAAPDAISKDFNVDNVLDDIFKKSVKLIERAVDEVIAGNAVVDENGRRLPLKMLMDCLEKAAQYQVAALKAKKSSNTGVDKEAMLALWKESAKMFINSRNKGIDYDEKAHVKHVLDQTFRKDNDE